MPNENTTPLNDDQLRAALTTRFAPGLSYLSYDAVDAVPLTFDFSADYDYDGTGESGSWRIAEHLTLEDQIEDLEDLEILSSEEGRDPVLFVTAPGESGQMEVSFRPAALSTCGDTDEDAARLIALGVADLEALGVAHGFDEDDDPNIASFYVDREDQGWEKLIEMHGLEPEVFDDDGDEDGWTPMMNYAYPLPSGVRTGETWHRAMRCTTVVEIGGESYLALTGGGMDLSWEIVETYLRCGYLPPAYFARRLPRMGSRGASETDRAILEACRLSLRYVASCAAQGLEDLDRVEQWAREQEAQEQEAKRAG